MRIAPGTTIWTKLKRWALDFDAWMNASAFESGRDASSLWERYTAFTDKLRARGAARVVLDLASEAVTLGLAGGFVLLALAMPAFDETNEDWRRTQDFAVTFLDRFGQEVGRRGIRHDDSVSLDDFPDDLIKAALATEDRRFFSHWGIDPVGTTRALVVNSRASGVVQGGSTITQQLAKNLFLSNERSLDRKIKEAFLALWLEFQLSKEEILKLYLDRAYMGGGNFGVAAAAEFYFGKSVKDITLAESAMLAGLFKAPSRFSPHVNLPAARARASDVLTNLVDSGFMSEGQVQTARRNPATAIDRGRDTTPDFYLDWAFEQVKQMAADGKFGFERVLIVKTPLDRSIQTRADTAVEDILRQHGEQYNVRQAAAVVMDPDGAVRAIVGGRDYGQSQFNRATGALRQPGSAFKPFVYATALSNLPYRPDSMVRDAPICLGNWCPNNYNRSFAGSMTMTVALARSINTIPVRFSLEIGGGNARAGRAKIMEMTERMGVRTPLTDTPSLPIGASEITVMDMTTGYAVFANGGRRVEPYIAVEVWNSSGERIYAQESEPLPEQVLATGVVADMNFMLSKVPETGTGRRAALEGVVSAGKTGTTNAYRDAWYGGYTGNFVTAVWFGNDNYESTNRMTGGSLPAMVWKEIMAYAHQDVEIAPIPGLDGSDGPLVAETGPVPDMTGSFDHASNRRTNTSLSRRSFEVLSGINRMFEVAERPAGGFPAAQRVPARERRAERAPGGFQQVGGRVGRP
ncbi:MAG TPA: PBP1A family penicillin-binding protein [Saliniramus sp.]|nr:PBP1A family penicillin-binding protein [Saliniramus sp.]